MKSLSLSSRAGIAQPSPTLAITAKAKAMKAEGVDVVSFGAGEPDFNTPEPICAAATQALDSGFTKYTATSGIPELKAAVVEKARRENGIAATPEQVVISCGAKHSIFNALWVLIEPGDEVIVLAPFWATYADQIRVVGGVPVVVDADASTDFEPDPDKIKSAISPKTKAIMVNSPCNPTGAVFPRETLKAIAALALRHGLWVICDEIYEKLVYGAEHHSIAAFGKDIAEQCVTIGGCSKSYAMTGWRIGYSIAPAPISKAISNFQDQVTSNPNSFAQKGAVTALQLPGEAVEKMRAEFHARRDLAFAELSKIDGLKPNKPKGAFYFFLDVRRFLQGPVSTDVELTDRLLEQAHVAVVPGSVFFGPGHLRLSYTASREDITRGIARIGEVLSQLM